MHFQQSLKRFISNIKVWSFVDKNHSTAATRSQCNSVTQKWSLHCSLCAAWCNPFTVAMMIRVSFRSKYLFLVYRNKTNNCKIFAKHLAFRIVGGQFAEIGLAPYMCALKIEIPRMRQGSLCGCSILSNKWVLTAAHCIQGYFKFYIIIDFRFLIMYYFDFSFFLNTRIANWQNMLKYWLARIIWTIKTIQSKSHHKALFEYILNDSTFNCNTLKIYENSFRQWYRKNYIICSHFSC